jgi:Ca2+-binding RTX toxin-like protein
MGTQNDDIIYDARITKEIFSSDSSDMLLVNAADTMMIGGKDDDMIVAGPGNDFVDGGPDNDVLLGGGGTDFIAGGLGNDKLFNGVGSAIIYDGKGADHFGCSNSALSLARSVVMDYNPTQGDKISGTCKHVS